jgi:hypothetical protein
LCEYELGEAKFMQRRIVRERSDALSFICTLVELRLKTNEC